MIWTRMYLLMLCACPAFIGCGESGPVTYPVSGVVRHDGGVLSGGNVTFVPDKGPGVVAPIGADGRFEMRAVAGRHRVAVRQPSAAGMSPETMADASRKKAFEVPQKYRRYDTSTIFVDVGPDGENEFDIALD